MSMSDVTSFELTHGPWPFNLHTVEMQTWEDDLVDEDGLQWPSRKIKDVAASLSAHLGSEYRVVPDGDGGVAFESVDYRYEIDELSKVRGYRQKGGPDWLVTVYEPSCRWLSWVPLYGVVREFMLDKPYLSDDSNHLRTSVSIVYHAFWILLLLRSVGRLCLTSTF